MSNPDNLLLLFPFGQGAIGTFIAILPRKLVKLISTFGFPSDGDMEQGLGQLEEVFYLGGCRSMLAALMVLSFVILLPPLFSLDTTASLSRAEVMLHEVFKRHPESCLFRWLQGKAALLRRDVSGALKAFNRATAANRQWPQLQHMCAFELGWSHFYNLQYEPAAAHWRLLFAENQWSKAFYAYMQACCGLGQLGLADSEQDHKTMEKQITELLRTAKHEASLRKFGGKVLDIEQWILRRAAGMLSQVATIKLFPPSLHII